MVYVFIMYCQVFQCTTKYVVVSNNIVNVTGDGIRTSTKPLQIFVSEEGCMDYYLISVLIFFPFPFLETNLVCFAVLLCVLRSLFVICKIFSTHLIFISFFLFIEWSGKSLKFSSLLRPTTGV